MGNATTQIYNQQLPNSRQQGHTAVYRKKGVSFLKQTPEEHIRSIADLLRIVKTRNSALSQILLETSKNSLGNDVDSRSLIKHPYAEVFHSASSLGKVLLHRKLYLIEAVRGMKLVGIYSKNRYEWFVTDWACALTGVTTVPLYDTLGVENISYCLNQTEITSLFVSAGTVGTLLTLKDLGKLKTLITFDELHQQIKEKIKKINLQLVSYAELVKEGEGVDINLEQIKPDYDDIYTFSYTSGTTGPPKGVLLSHGNMLACMATFDGHQDFKITQNDHILSYLPLPHVMERVVSLFSFYNGVSVYISCGNVQKLKDDCAFVRPTLMASVPRLYNRIVEAVKAKFENTTGISKFLVEQAVSKKMHSAKTDGTYTNRFYDPLVFSKVKEGFGGRIRMFVSGSAPISPEVLAYMKTIMCCPFIEGYGQTEDTAAVLFGRAMDKQYGTLCELGVAAEMRLADLPQMRYTANDVDENGRPTPRGEIQVRGPQVFKGYYKLDQMTNETITEDGWLRTGDIAQFIPQRLSFKIIDRKKNIFKLQQGEYVAPDKVESIYMETGLLTELFLHGESSQNFAVVVAVPNKQKLLKLAEQKNISGSFQQLCVSKQVRCLLLGELNRHGKKSGLYGFELAKNVYLQTGTFLARNILTNTLKLIRFEARQFYKQEIKALYEEGELAL